MTGEKKKPTLTILRGLPASGKSTWARKKVEKNPTGVVRVNRDDIRKMLHDGTWSKGRERVVRLVRDAIITAALEDGKDVICDDTNLAVDVVDGLTALGLRYGPAETQFFDVSVEVCIERDSKRSHPVGEVVIRKMWRDHLRPAPAVPPPGATPAIIVDMDGTLAKMNGRSPFAWARVGEDLPNQPVLDTVCALSWADKGLNVLVVSARDEVCRPETTDWLFRHGVPFHALLMRPQGDNRKDSVVKRELYETFIAGVYAVKLVLDDRNQVVSLWRELGLTCFQVGEGDF